MHFQILTSVLKPVFCSHCYLHNDCGKNPSCRSEPTVRGRLQIVINLVSTHRQLELSTHSIFGSLLKISVLVITFRAVHVLNGLIANTNHKEPPNVCRQRQVQRAGTYLTFLCLVSNWQQNKWVGIAVYFLSWLVKKKQKLCLQTKLFS